MPHSLFVNVAGMPGSINRLAALSILPLCYISMHLGTDTGLLFQLCKSLHSIRTDPLCMAMHIWYQFKAPRPAEDFVDFILLQKNCFSRLSMSAQSTILDIMLQLQFMSRTTWTHLVLACAAKLGDLDVMTNHLAGATTIGLHKALDFAVRYNHIAIVRILLRAGAIVSKKNMRYACKYARDDMVFTLFSVFMNIGVTVQYACAEGRTTILRYLIRIGGSPTAGLFTAIMNGHTRVVRFLLTAGGIANEIHFSHACYIGHAGIVRVLLKGGGFILDQTHLFSACNNGHTELVKVLLKEGLVAHQLYLLAALTGGHANVVKVLLKEGGLVMP